MESIWTKKNVTYKLEMFPKVAGQTLLEYKEFRRGCGLDLPSASVVVELFDGWDKFKEEVYGDG